MVKKCFICEEKPAEYKIRDTNDFYCRECAERNFAELDYLEKIEKSYTEKKSSEKIEVLLN